MNLIADARPLVRRRLKSGNDSIRYAEVDLDDGISIVGKRFAQDTRCTKQTNSFDALLDDEDVDFSAISYFRPEFIQHISLSSSDFATATIVAGAVTAIAVNSSLIYTVAPAVTFASDSGTGAIATAHLTLGRVTSITVGTAGSGYTSAPIVLLDGVRCNFSARDLGPGIRKVSIEDLAFEKSRCGAISGVPRLIAFPTWTAGKIFPAPKADATGSVIWSPPFTTWSKGKAMATAVLTAAAVTSITVNNGGTYDTAPTVTFSGGGGSGAAATAVLTDYKITSFNVSAGGTLYTSAPTVLLNGVAATDVLLNIPDDLLEPLLGFAAALIPQLTENEAIDKMFRGQLWRDQVSACRGKGNLGDDEIERFSVRDIRRQAWR